MRYSITNTDREFSPKEAEAVSGVPTVLQRDWRRRGFLPEREGDGWSKFSLSDVIRMTVMRAYSQSGLSLEAAEGIAGLAVLPVLAALVNSPTTAVFEGDPVSDDMEKRVRRGAISGVTEDDRFSFVALPARPDGLSGSRLKNLADGAEVMSAAQSFHAIVVDHWGIAAHIARHADLPLIRFIVTAEAEKPGEVSD